MEISIYSKLTDEELEIFYAQHTAKYGKALLDNTRPLNERMLSKLIAKSVGKYNQEAEHFSVCECLKEYLYRKSKEIAKLTYIAMDKRNDFSLPGEQRISISFCRNIMGISNNRAVTQFDADRFEKIINECDRRNGCKSGDEYLEYVKNYSLEIFGKKYPITDTDIFIDLHELLAVDWYFWTVLCLPYGARFILGVLEKREIENNKIWVMTKEYVRSPQLHLSIAAEVFKDTTIIRQEALNAIFFNKWQEHFDQSKAEQYRASLHPNSSIREGIIKKALAFSDAFNTKDVLKIKDPFINEMIDGTVWHEMGHHTAFKDFDPVHYDFHYVMINSDHSCSVIQEALADWAPRKDNKQGAFSRFLQIAQTDPKRAIRDIWVYMSDCWFPDEKEEYMSLYSNVLVGLTLFFINQDGTVDFKRLAAEKDRIYMFLQEKFKNIAEQLLTVLRQSEYDFKIKKLNFSELEEKELIMHQKSGKTKSLEELRKSDAYYENMLGYLEKFSKDGWKQYQDIINKEDKLLEQEILGIVAKGNEEKYNYSLRKYIVKRAKEIGIIQKMPKKRTLIEV